MSRPRSLSPHRDRDTEVTHNGITPVRHHRGWVIKTTCNGITLERYRRDGDVVKRLTRDSVRSSEGTFNPPLSVRKCRHLNRTDVNRGVRTTGYKMMNTKDLLTRLDMDPGGLGVYPFETN